MFYNPISIPPFPPPPSPPPSPSPSLPASTCQQLLQRRWPPAGTGHQRTEALECLLRYHIEWSPDPLGVMETVAGEGMVELLGEEASDESSLYPTLSKYTCSALAIIHTYISHTPMHKL